MRRRPLIATRYVTLPPNRSRRVRVPMFVTQVSFGPKIYAYALGEDGRVIYPWAPMISKQNKMDLAEEVHYVRLKNLTKKTREVVLKFKVEI